MSGDTTNDLAGSLLRLVAESTGFDAALAATLRLACGAAGWEYGEAWVPATTDSNGNVNPVASAVPGADAGGGAGGTTEVSDPEEATAPDTAEPAAAVDRLVAGPTYDPDDRFAAFTAVGTDLGFAPGEGLVGRAWESGEPTWCHVLDETSFLRHEAAAEAGFDTAVAVPVVADGEPLAVLVFFATRRRDTDAAFADAVATAVRALGRVYVRKRATDAVEAERASLDAIVEAVPVGVIVVDTDGTIERVNQLAADLLGIEPSELVGASVLADSWQPRSLDGGDARLFEHVVTTGEPVIDRRIMVSAAGRDVTMSASAAPLRDADGQIIAVIGTIVDATERVDYERQLVESNRQLDSFASVLSHDIRSPLAVAAGFLELARETGDVEHFERVERSHGRIEELVDTLLVLARSGELAGMMERVAVGTIAEAAWETVDHGDATLVVDDAGELDADPARLRQLFENLFRNAVEHGGGSVTITVGPLSDAAGFYVADDGVGIPLEEREEVLRPGHRSRGGGIGLGLSIVAAIAEGHGWTVEVTEPDTGGARFEFRTTASE